MTTLAGCRHRKSPQITAFLAAGLAERIFAPGGSGAAARLGGHGGQCGSLYLRLAIHVCGPRGPPARPRHGGEWGGEACTKFAAEHGLLSRPNTGMFKHAHELSNWSDGWSWKVSRTHGLATGPMGYTLGYIYLGLYLAPARGASGHDPVWLDPALPRALPPLLADCPARVALEYGHACPASCQS